MNEVTRTDQEWEVLLKTSRSKAVEGILQHGIDVWEYKQSCEKTKGGSKFTQNIFKWLGYSQPTASEWCKIGENSPKLIGAADKFGLPASQTTIYLLASVPEQYLPRIASREVTREEVKSFLQALEAPAPVTKVYLSPEAFELERVELTSEQRRRIEESLKDYEDEPDHERGTMPTDRAQDKLKEQWDALFQPDNEAGLALMRFCFNRAYHPDAGVLSKNGVLLSEINGLITLLMERSE